MQTDINIDLLLIVYYLVRQLKKIQTLFYPLQDEIKLLGSFLEKLMRV